MKEALGHEVKLDKNQMASAYEVQKSKEVLIPLPYMQGGHTMWEVNHSGDTIVIDKAKLSQTQAHWDDKLKSAVQFIVVKPGMQYISALNEDNALKRYCKANRIPFKHTKKKKC